MPQITSGTYYSVASGPHYVSLSCAGVYLSEITVFAVCHSETPDDVTLVVAQSDARDALKDSTLELHRDHGTPMEREIARQVYAQVNHEKIRVDLDCHLAAHEQDIRDYARQAYLERQWDDRQASF